MSKEQFLQELSNRLARMPEEEREAALMYYEEYFAEAGEGNEAKAMSEIGSPAQIAKQLMGDYVVKEAEVRPIPPKKSFNMIWVVLLAVFASPIALPLAIAFVAVVFALVVTVGALLFAGVITAGAIFISGVVSVIVAIVTLFMHPATGIFTLGVGMFLTGIGILLVWSMYVAIEKLVPAMTKSIVSLSNKVRGGQKA